MGLRINGFRPGERGYAAAMPWLARSWSSPVVRAGLVATAPLAAGALGVRIMARSGATSAQLGLQIGALALGFALALAVAALGPRRLPGRPGLRW